MLPPGGGRMEIHMNNKLNKLSLKDIGPARIAILAICGIFLLVSSFPIKKSGLSGETGKKGGEDSSVKSYYDQEYIRQQENRLKQILQTVEGVGKVEVMITLRSSGEAVLNKDYSREEAGQSESEGSDSKNSDSIKEGEERSALSVIPSRTISGGITGRTACRNRT
jgi:stage III sporulation protein AG